MYIKIGKTQYPCTRRIVTGDTIKYLSVSPNPGEVTGKIQMYRDDGFLLSEDNADEYARQTYAGTILTLTNKPEPVPVPTAAPEPQATRAETLAAVSFARMMLPTVQSSMSAGDTITVAALYAEWTEGAYQVGDIRLVWYGGAHQLWKCRQAHDTTTYPDITPDGTAWRTFWIPFHGTSPETAQDWIAPTMAEDIYKAGEYMIYTDGKTYRCLSDTNFSPEEYAQAWEVQ